MKNANKMLGLKQFGSSKQPVFPRGRQPCPQITLGVPPSTAKSKGKTNSTLKTRMLRQRLFCEVTLENLKNLQLRTFQISNIQTVKKSFKFPTINKKNRLRELRVGSE